MVSTRKRQGDRRVSTPVVSSSNHPEAVSMSSPISHLVCNNDPPSEIERTRIELAISRAEKKRVALLNERNSSEVARVQRSLKELDSFINTHKPVLSTLRHLPYDILSYIFTLCLEPIRTRPWNRMHWHTIPSFALSQVCRRWRAVALETPILWSFLGDVQLNLKSRSRFGYSYSKFLEILLRRSKTLDLWIYVYAPFRALDTQPHAIAPLVRHADRWSVVAFETTPSVVAIFRGIRHRLPRLQSLSLYFGWGGDAIILNIFSDAPSLTEVTISGLNLPLELPWGQLKSFNEHVRARQCSQVAHIFNNATDSLEHLTMTLRPLVLLCMKTCFNMPVTFPRLKTMELISVNPDNNVGCFIDALTLPCLEELHLAGCWTSPLLQFFRRSFEHSTRAPLKRLSLSGDRNIVEILRLVPHLEHLEVDGGVVDKISGNNEHDAPLLPELNTLVVTSRRTPWDTIDPIVMLARSRYKRTTPAEDDALNHSRRTLTDISVTSHFREDTLMLQSQLNGWCESSALVIDKHSQYGRILHFQLPAIQGGRITQPRPNSAVEVDDVLTCIESWPPKVNYIYATPLYHPLRRLSLLSKRQILGDDEYHLRKRAKAIIEDWDAIIRADIMDVNSPWRKNWVLREDETSLRYLPDDYVFRSVSEAMQLIFGLDQHRRLASWL